MIRIPDAGRFELRLADGAANPYLLQAGAAGRRASTASRNSRDPGQRLDINMYTEGHKVDGARKLPLNLLDAVRALEGSDVARAGFGEELVDAYCKLKLDEWNRYCSVVTDWERETTLDC